MEEPKQLQAGETIRCYITAERYIDLHHTGWNVEASSPQGVSTRQEERNKLTVVTVDRIHNELGEEDS